MRQDDMGAAFPNDVYATPGRMSGRLHPKMQKYETRNNAIWHMWLSGKSQTEVARQFGLSRQRISWIIMRGRRIARAMDIFARRRS